MIVLIMLVIFLGGVLASFLMCYADRFGVKKMTGRSVCDACGCILPNAALIPFVGGMFGCRTCHARASWVYMVLEILFAGVFSLLVWSIIGYFGISVIGIVSILIATIILSLLFVLALIDARHYVFPSVLLGLLYVVVVGGVIVVHGYLFSESTTLVQAIKQIVVSGSVWLASLLAISVGSREKWMGDGDGILMGAFGVIISPWIDSFPQTVTLLMATLCIASITGLVWAYVENYRRTKSFTIRRGYVVPFGPSLIISFVGVFIVTVMV